MGDSARSVLEQRKEDRSAGLEQREEDDGAELEQREEDTGAGPEQREEDGGAGPKQSVSALEFEAFIRQHITAAEAEAQRGRRGHGPDDSGFGEHGRDDGIFFPGGGGRPLLR